MASSYIWIFLGGGIGPSGAAQLLAWNRTKNLRDPTRMQQILVLALVRFWASTGQKCFT
jgi:hypothetical protein